MNYVNFQVELTAENAPKIDEISQLLLGKAHTQETTTKPTDTTKATAKTTTKSTADTDEMSLADFKTAVKKAKADHGEDFVKTVLVDNGAEKGTPLGRMVSAIEAEDYENVVEKLEAGPAKAEEAEEEDDGFGDEEDASEVDAEAVKTAAKAYAKEVGRDDAKAIMLKHGAATITKINDCSVKQLQAMFKDLTA